MKKYFLKPELVGSERLPLWHRWQISLPGELLCILMNNITKHTVDVENRYSRVDGFFILGLKCRGQMVRVQPINRLKQGFSNRDRPKTIHKFTRPHHFCRSVKSEVLPNTAGHLTGKHITHALDLYSGGTRFASRSGHRLPRLRSFVVTPGKFRECTSICFDESMLVFTTLRATAHQLRQDKHKDMRQKRQKLTSAS
jgi:hypothetical protein